MTDRTAIVTGASTGIGAELARLAASEGYNLILVADDDRLDALAEEVAGTGVAVTTLRVDLATRAGVERLVEEVHGLDIDVLCANAGRGLSGALIDLGYDDWRHVVETNVVGTTHLLQEIARKMQARGSGRILVTGSIAGLGPGPYEQVYSGTKAYLNSLAHALREELREAGVSVTLLMPAATDTRIFERGGYQSTKLANGPLADPAEVARDGWQALLAGDAEVITAQHARAKAAEMKDKDADQLLREHVEIARPGSRDD